MKFKYFQITEEESLNHIEQCLVSIEVRNKAIMELTDSFGSEECLQFSRGGIAAFSFISTPDKSIWKAVKHGFMPKAKTNELKMIAELPKSIDYQEVIKKYGFGGEMIIGEPTGASRGFPMYSSSIKGNRKTNFYVIKVPYDGEFKKEIHESLKELKEWEMIKGIDGDEGDK